MLGCKADRCLRGTVGAAPRPRRGGGLRCCASSLRNAIDDSSASIPVATTGRSRTRSRQPLIKSLNEHSRPAHRRPRTSGPERGARRNPTPRVRRRRILRLSLQLRDPKLETRFVALTTGPRIAHNNIAHAQPKPLIAALPIGHVTPRTPLISTTRTLRFARQHRRHAGSELDAHFDRRQLRLPPLDFDSLRVGPSSE